MTTERGTLLIGGCLMVVRLFSSPEAIAKAVPDRFEERAEHGSPSLWLPPVIDGCADLRRKRRDAVNSDR